MRRMEVIEHGARAASLDHRAMEQLERGHVGRAIALEDRARDQRVEMVGAAIHPHHHHHHYYPPPPPVGVVVAAEAAMVAGAVVKGAVVGAEVAAINRQRDIREAELIAAASNPYRGGYGPVYVEPVMPGAYPPYSGGAYYPPGGAYPPAAYPPAGYPSSGYPPSGYPPAGYPPGYPY